jgi:hypothetical protein
MATSPSGNSQPQAEASALPLGWTRIQRGRKRPADGMTDDNDGTVADWFCCDDPACRKTKPVIAQAAIQPKDKEDELRRIRGTGIFCLTDNDPSWFQGYFFPGSSSTGTSTGTNRLSARSKSKPWGLLCIQEEIDDCLQCSEGGYRQLSISLTPFGVPAESVKQQTFKDIAWTGGDMMRLQQSGSSSAVTMEADQLLTGKPAVPYVEKIFGSLLRTLREGEACDSGTGVLDLMPNVAVVIGKMEVTVEIAKLTPSKMSNDDLFDD